MSIAEVVSTIAGGTLPFHFTAFDGSETGDKTSPFGLHLKSQKGLNYLVTAPGDLGLARAYISGELELIGAHESDPYPAFKDINSKLTFQRPSARKMAQIASSLGLESFKPVTPPPQETLPRWRRVAIGLRHSKGRDAESIHHHYDVSNAFYEWVLGPSMTYTCACYETPETSLEDAQENKYRLVFDKLGLKAGDRLLDIGCGWGGMVRYAAKRGVYTIGVTLSADQASWGQRAVIEQGLTEYADIRHSDYRDVVEHDFDAVSSIGLTEHIGVANYPAYFAFISGKLRPGGRFLNHSITRPDNGVNGKAGAFIDRYVFPDGELTGSGKIISVIQNSGALEVTHEENLRPHYAMTLRDWNENLTANWDKTVAEVGIGTARTWGLYLAACRLAFDRNVIQLHQVLGTKVPEDGAWTDPLRPWWKP